jgi:exoribonuclease II
MNIVHIILQKYGINIYSIDSKNKNRPILEGISIDNNDAYFHDDGIKLYKQKAFFVLEISISDVSEFVTKDSKLDILAKEQLFQTDQSSLYPVDLKKACLSLSKSYKKHTLTLTLKLDNDLNVISRDISKTRFVNKNNYSYNQYDRLLDTNQRKLDFHTKRLSSFAEKLFYKKNLTHKRLLSDEIVKEIMILANSQIAIYCSERNIPIIYENKEAETKNKYTTQVTNYATFTSPMRKYVDFVTHSQIKSFLDRDKSKDNDDFTNVEYIYSQDELNQILKRLNEINNRRFINHHLRKNIQEVVFNKKELTEEVVCNILVQIRNNQADPYIMFYVVFSLHFDKTIRDELFNKIKKNKEIDLTKALFSFIKYISKIEISLMNKHVGQLSNQGRFLKVKKSEKRNSSVIIKIDEKEHIFTEKKKPNEMVSSKAMERMFTKLYKIINENNINIFH